CRPLLRICSHRPPRESFSLQLFQLRFLVGDSRRTLSRALRELGEGAARDGHHVAGNEEGANPDPPPASQMRALCEASAAVCAFVSSRFASSAAIWASSRGDALLCLARKLCRS